MNLVIALLSTRSYITAEKIRSSVAGYADSASDEAFSRMFERDKNELRDLGIPLETGRVSSFDPIEGYRINRDAYALPAVELTGDEAAAVAVATQLWESPELITATQGALLKLRAAGVDVDPLAPIAIASPAGQRGTAWIGRRSRTAALGDRRRAGRAVSAPAVPHGSIHRAHGRAVGRGDREGPLVSRRARPRPRRHPHLPAVQDRRRGDTDRPGRCRHPARGCRPARDRGQRRRRRADGRAGSGLGRRRAGHRAAARRDIAGFPAGERPRRRRHRTRHRNYRSSGARHRRIRPRRCGAGTGRRCATRCWSRLRAHAGEGQA